MGRLILKGTIDSDGGDTVRTWEYRIANSQASLASATWLEAPDQENNQLYLPLDDLTDGSEYFFQTRAVNTIGTGPESDVGSAIVPPATAPSKAVIEATPYADAPQIAIRASVDDGGSSVLRWEYKFGFGEFAEPSLVVDEPWIEIPNSSVSSIFFELDELLPDNFYWVLARAVNEVGEGERSDIVSALVPKVVPYRPAVILSVVDSVIDARITINALSESDGASPITKWETRHIPVYPGGAEIEEATWTEVSGASGLAMTHTLTGLRENQEYEIEVRATNAIGRSETSLTSSIFTGDLPTTPEIPTFTLAPIADGYGLRLDASVGDGGNAITRWEYRFATTAAGVPSATWIAVPNATGDTVTNVAIGTDSNNPMDDNTLYYVQIRAINQVGASAPSAVQTETTTDLIERPSAPVLTHVTTYGDTTVHVLLQANVTDNGGAAITSWQYRQAGTSGGLASAAWQTISNASGSTLSHQLRDLTRADIYFQVRCANSIGNSPVSNAVFSPGVIAPEKPVLTATTDSVDGHHRINLTASTGDNGGASITDWQYKVATSETGLGTASWVSTRETGNSLTAFAIENLALSTTYHFQVRCYNGEFYSPASDSASASTTAAEKPDKPTLALTALGGGFTMTASLVSDNGAAVTAWQYRYATTSNLLESASWIEATGQSGNSMSFTVRQLAGETSFMVQVRAVNSVGSSDPSATQSTTTLAVVDPPGTPTIGSWGRQGLSISYNGITIPDSGGPATTWQYRYATSEAGLESAEWQTVDSTVDYNEPGNVTGRRIKAIVIGNTGGLAPSTSYYLQVRASNGGGTSSPSASRQGTNLSGAGAPSVPILWLQSTTSTIRLLTNTVRARGAPVTRWQYSLDGGAWTTIAGETGTRLDHTLTGISSGTHTVRVRCSNSVGTSSVSSVNERRITMTNDRDVPDTPSISFTWDRRSNNRFVRQSNWPDLNEGSNVYREQYKFGNSMAAVATAEWSEDRFVYNDSSSSGEFTLSFYTWELLGYPSFVAKRVRNVAGWSAQSNIAQVQSSDAGGLSEGEGDPPPLDQSPQEQNTSAPSFRLTEGAGSIRIDWTEPAEIKPQPWPFGQIEGYDSAFSANDSTFYETEILDLGTSRVVKAKIGYPDLFAPDNSDDADSETGVELTLLYGTAQNNLTSAVVARNAETTVTARYLKARVHMKKTKNRALPNITLTTEDV